MSPTVTMTKLRDPSSRKLGRSGRVAAWCHDHRRAVLVAWVLALVLMIGIATTEGDDFQDNFNGGNSQSQRAQDLLHDTFPAQAGDMAQVVFHTHDRIGTEANRARIDRVVGRLASLGAGSHVSAVRRPFTAPGAAGQVSGDGHTAFAVVQFDVPTGSLPKAAITRVVDVAEQAPAPGFEVELGGFPIEKIETPSFGPSEAIGILAAIVILLVAFGSVIAMGLPILTALLGVGIAMGLISLTSHGLVTPTFAPDFAVMIGIGVGIDYALFIVTRYREELHDGLPPRDAVIRAMTTSGRAVVFAGSTVVVSMLGLFLLGLPYIYGTAVGAIAAVLLVMAGSLTLLPAVLGYVGHTIDRLHVPTFSRHTTTTPRRPVAYRWSRMVQHHPVTLGTLALAALLALALPLFSMRLAFSDAGNDLATLTTRRAYDLLADGFGPGFNGPLVIAVRTPDTPSRSAATNLDAALGHTPGVAAVTPVRFNPAATTAVIVAYPTSSPQSDATQQLVHQIRDDVAPHAVHATNATVDVGGVTAMSIDASSHLASRLWWIIGLVVGLSFLLLMAVFRSVAVPLKAAVMNLLSVGAAYGVIVAVFQWGWGASLIGVSRTGPIDPFIPLFMFATLFGLSMDYEVFLLSRIREDWRRSGDNSLAVADGLAATARVITAAALIMVSVFGAFVLGDNRVLKLFGLGLAAAILVDATLVRLVLVPATMEQLGRANWWLPHWLDRLLPTIDVEGNEPLPSIDRPETDAAGNTSDSEEPVKTLV